jgi:DNA-binding HxlR family transcriptional regulator
MALPNDYATQSCSLARALEVIGERWTLLIVRDAFFGVRRFGDLAAHLQMPRAVLAGRLKRLTEEGLLDRVQGNGRWEEYELTDKGIALWPTVRALTAWGEEHYAGEGARRVYLHALDDGRLDARSQCLTCGAVVGAPDTVIAPGPGLAPPSEEDDPITKALAAPHRLLTPVRTHGDVRVLQAADQMPSSV